MHNYTTQKGKGNMSMRKRVRVCLISALGVSLMMVMMSCGDDNITNNRLASSGGTPAQGTPSPPAEITDQNLLLNDPLTNGTTKATQIGGGEFTSEGYHLTSHFGYIIYDTQIRGNFRV